MKLYTEEQVRKLIDGYYDVNWTIYDSFDELTPIELPSDVEIASKILKLIKNDDQKEYGKLAYAGALWMLDQIKQQADGK